jgi:uncharacterized repeat protein (TIGR01451 family)/CSLREA domain-containing protein
MSSANALTFVVDSTADAVDAAPGDGVCLTADGTCTLRAAIMEANALAGADSIDLSAINDPLSPIVLTLEGVDEVIGPPEPGSPAPCAAQISADASIGDLDITEDLEIFGAGPGLTVIEWLNQSLDDPNVGDRIFHVQAEPEETVNLVRIADLMIRNGSVGTPNTTDEDNVYNCEVSGEPGSIVAWQFKRVGGGIAVGPGAAVFLFEEAEHGPGGGGGDGGPPTDPGGDEGEGGVLAVEFERLALIDNQAGSDGGAILAAAEMTILDSVLSGNLSAANGGALYLDSPTTIQGTLIGTASTDVPYASGAIPVGLVSEPNRAENGGGIFDTGSHTTHIDASAIVGNNAIGGGGIAARALVVINITNTTVSGNTGTDVGGGITTNGTVNLRNATIANNVATTDAPGGGAGLNAFGSGTFVFYNTILANNRVEGGEAAREANCGCSGGTALCPTGRMVSTGYNISDESTDTCSLSIALNDQPATDPLLAPLANNGGLTETHALPSQAIGDLTTSPAIDSADNLRCPNNDQRGMLRPDDGDADGSYNCDVGAFELFIMRADLHINNVTMQNMVDKGETFTAVIEIHNDDANAAASDVEFTATLSTLTDMDIVSAVPSVGTCGIPAHAVSCSLGDMAIGAIETVTLTLVGDAQGEYSLESTVQTPDGAVDPVPGNNTVISNVTVRGNSDIALTADPVPATVDRGDVITFTFTVVNNGEDAATSVRLGMLIPSGVSYVGGMSTKGSCAAGGGEVLCTIGALALAESATVDIQMSADRVGDKSFRAVVAADQNDPASSNNSVTASVSVVANADLELDASAPGSVTVGDNFSVTATVTNNGPQDATNVVATLTLPALVTFVSSDDCVANGNVIECMAASIPAAGTATFSAVLNADSTGTASVTGSVVAAEDDTDLANNSLTFSVTISDSPPTVQPTSDGGGGGGCVYDPNASFDPTLLALLALALLALGRRVAVESKT